jgi:hypothetical protein
VYPCGLCGGLHVGHDPNNERTKRARVIRKRLRSIEKQLAAFDKHSGELRRERQKLLAEQGIRIVCAPSRLRRYLIRIEAWLASNS